MPSFPWRTAIVTLALTGCGKDGGPSDTGADSAETDTGIGETDTGDEDSDTGGDTDPTNRAPTATLTGPTSGYVLPADGADVQCTANDPDADDAPAAEVTVSVGSATDDGGGLWTLNVPDTVGLVTVTCTADDGRGGTDTATLELFALGSLVGWWPLDGTGTDLGPHSLTATFKGTGVSPTNGQDGGANGSLDFGGSGWLEVADNDVLDLSTFTIAAFVWADAVTVENPVLGRGETSVALQFGLDVTASDAQFFPNEASYMSNSYVSVIRGDATDTWHHLAVGVQGTQSLRIWRDGSGAASTAQTTAPTPPDPGPLRIGATIEPGGSIPGFDGRLDEVMLFSRVLNDTEMAALHTWLSGT